MYCLIAILIFISAMVWTLASLGVEVSTSALTFEFGQSFQILSALATLAAAVAAWKAAKHSEAQGLVIVEQQQWQKRQAHYSEFSSLISDLENHYDVRFYQPLRLYVAMFPNARKDGAEFNLNCDVNFIENARLRWDALVCQAVIGVTEIDIGLWMAEANKVAIDLRMDFMGTTDQPVYAYQGIPTGFTSTNYAKVEFKVTNCVATLAMFCGLPSMDHPKLPCAFLSKLRIEIDKERELTS